VCFGDFGTDIKAQAKSSGPAANFTPEKRLEKSFKRLGLNGISKVGHGQFK
jgi:hypothetical protein